MNHILYMNRQYYLTGMERALRQIGVQQINPRQIGELVLSFEMPHSDSWSWDVPKIWLRFEHFNMSLAKIQWLLNHVKPMFVLVLYNLYPNNDKRNNNDSFTQTLYCISIYINPKIAQLIHNMVMLFLS